MDLFLMIVSFGRDLDLLFARRLCIAELRSQDAECGQDLHVSKNGLETMCFSAWAQSIRSVT